VRIIAKVAVALAALLAVAPAASAHQGNPDFLSEVTAVEPADDGVVVEVLNRDDRLLMHNTSGKDVVIYGYDEEPYARLLADGTVEVNQNSPATFLNEERFADVEDPPGNADADAEPDWRKESGTGRFEWHDHRSHWMSEARPPQVTDPDLRTRIFRWNVPISIGGERGEIDGDLFWTPQDDGGGPPIAAIVALAAIVIAGCIAVIAVRHRRGGGPSSGDRGQDAPGPPRPATEKAEAW
jgi:hypothetical protein